MTFSAEPSSGRHPSGKTSGASLGAKGKDYIIKNYEVMNFFLCSICLNKKTHDLTWVFPKY
ncbi:hypothetical protein A3N51_17945 [Enterobacter kobei]|uniref:hypothetical protein n=1 Tax=Enterobacter kobei TaxID=208224 RepID=UPI0007B3EB1D|nr:hypothetical protein A3N51_17945 [Enterobacter kobei]